MNKQELENRIKDLESDIQASQNTIEKLKKAIVDMEEKAWKPKENETYYSIVRKKAEDFTYVDDDFDKYALSVGNYFKTEKQAERALFEQNLRLKLRKFAEDNNDKIDWNDETQSKYYIYFDINNKIIDVKRLFYQRDFGEIYFLSKETAEKAIEQFHDELMKYFTEQ